MPHTLTSISASAAANAKNTIAFIHLCAHNIIPMAYVASTLLCRRPTADSGGKTLGMAKAPKSGGKRHPVVGNNGKRLGIVASCARLPTLAFPGRGNPFRFELGLPSAPPAPRGCSLGAPQHPEKLPMPIAESVVLGKNVSIYHPSLVNLYGCTIGDDTKIGTFVEIQKNAIVGARCKISSHTFICEGVVIEDEVFVGHGVMFTNDRYPRATNPDGSLQTEVDWKLETTRVQRGASIGTGATIISGVTIGKGALVGAGAVVNKDVPDYTIVVGVPARVVGDTRNR